MGAGKDTVADRIYWGYGFARFAFGRKVKEVAKELFPGTYLATLKPRGLLQAVGQKMREIDKDCWTDYVMRQTDGLRGNIVITDCRYLNELEIAQKHGFIPVRIESTVANRYNRLLARDGVVEQHTDKHISETDLDGVKVPYTLDNNGTLEELYTQVDGLIRRLGGQK